MPCADAGAETVGVPGVRALSVSDDSDVGTKPHVCAVRQDVVDLRIVEPVCFCGVVVAPRLPVPVESADPARETVESVPSANPNLISVDLYCGYVLRGRSRLEEFKGVEVEVGSADSEPLGRDPERVPGIDQYVQYPIVSVRTSYDVSVYVVSERWCDRGYCRDVGTRSRLDESAKRQGFQT